MTTSSRLGDMRPIALALMCAAVAAMLPIPTGAVAGEEVMTGLLSKGIAAPSIVPDRGSEGQGPFEQLVIMDATIVDGTGAEPYGPPPSPSKRIASLR